MSGYNIYDSNGLPMKNDGRANVTCPKWMVERIKEIARKNNCCLSDIYRQAIHEWLMRYDLTQSMASGTVKNNTPPQTVSVAIPREWVK